jgi:hypothetical protein
MTQQQELIDMGATAVEPSRNPTNTAGGEWVYALVPTEPGAYNLIKAAERAGFHTFGYTIRGEGWAVWVRLKGDN